MAKYSIREIVEMAVQTEKLGLEFYNQMLGKFAHIPELGALFSTLAKMEKSHVEIFSALLGKIPEGAVAPEGWDEAEHYFRAVVESEFFLGTGKALPSMASMDDPFKAVDFALAFEKETLLYYIGIEGALPVEDRLVIDDIIREEKSHIVWLSRYRDIHKI